MAVFEGANGITGIFCAEWNGLHVRLVLEKTNLPFEINRRERWKPQFNGIGAIAPRKTFGLDAVYIAHIAAAIDSGIGI